MATSFPPAMIRLAFADDEGTLDMAPLQGSWTPDQYLRLTDQTNRLIEYTDSVIEVLPMPTERHQLIVRSLFLALLHYLGPRSGMVLFAPLRLRIAEGMFREPDILLLRDANDPRRHNRYWLGADLVMEVVSPDHPERDTVEKRADYARAGIPEYWIVDPRNHTIVVLRLQDDDYGEHGMFVSGDMATSALLDGFAVGVDATFAAGDV